MAHGPQPLAAKLNTPRSYLLDMPQGGQLRRNRRHIAEQVQPQNVAPQPSEPEAPPQPTAKPVHSSETPVSRYGRRLKKTQRYTL